jgi:hypothetical protein
MPFQQKEKRSKKEKRISKWKTEGVSRLLTRQTNNKRFL